MAKPSLQKCVEFDKLLISLKVESKMWILHHNTLILVFWQLITSVQQGVIKPHLLMQIGSGVC